MLADEKKVEELIEKSVQKHFKLAFENVEEVRKSPAVTLIRIEDRLNSLERRMERDMVTRAEFANFRGEIKGEISSLRGDLKGEIASIRAEHKDDIASCRLELKDDIANTRSELKNEITILRTKDIAEVKDGIWKLKLFIVLLGILVILTNPKVIELVGKLFSLF